MTPLRFVGAPDSPHNPNPADHQVRTPKCRPAALRTTEPISWYCAHVKDGHWHFQVRAVWGGGAVAPAARLSE